MTSPSLLAHTRLPVPHSSDTLAHMSEVHDLGKGVLVWQRRIDEEALEDHWRRFGLWYAAPAAVGALIAIVLGGFGEMLGVLILLGGIGAMIAGWIYLHGKSMRANPEIRVIDGQLVQANNTVTVADIEAWTTHRSTASGGGGVGNNGPAAMVILRIPVIRDGVRGVRPDGGEAFELVRLPWPEMTPDELTGVRTALTPHIPAAWVTIDQINY